MNPEIDWIRELHRQAEEPATPLIDVSSRVLDVLRHQPEPRIDRSLVWMTAAASILMIATVSISFLSSDGREEDVTYLALTVPTGIDEFEALEQVMQ